MFTERESHGNTPEGINVIPTQPEIPKHIEARDGVQVVSQQPSAVVVTDDAQAVQAKSDDNVVIVLPTDPQTLTQQVKKGNIKDAVTWLSVFWLRMIKKASHFGWRVEQK